MDEGGRAKLRHEELCEAARKRLRDETRNWSNRYDIELNDLLKRYIDETKENATLESHLKIICQLLKHGANVDTLLNNRFWPTEALAWLCKLSSSDLNKPVDMAKILLKMGAKVAEADLEDKPCLLSATGYELLEFLINNGADINAVDPTSGDTKLHILAKSDSLKEVKILISKGADIKKLNNLGHDVLVVAIKENSKETLLYLLESFDYPAKTMFLGYQMLGCMALYESLVEEKEEDPDYIDYGFDDEFLYPGLVHRPQSLNELDFQFDTSIAYWRMSHTYLADDESANNSQNPNYETMNRSEVIMRAMFITSADPNNDLLFDILESSTKQLHISESIKIRIMAFVRFIGPKKIKTSRCFDFVLHMICLALDLQGNQYRTNLFYRGLFEFMSESFDDSHWFNLIKSDPDKFLNLLILTTENWDNGDLLEKLAQVAIRVNPVEPFRKYSLLHQILDFHQECEPSCLIRLFVMLVENGINLKPDGVVYRIERFVVDKMVTSETKFSLDDFGLIMQSLLRRAVCVCPAVVGSKEYKIWRDKIDHKLEIPKLSCLAAAIINDCNVTYDPNEIGQVQLDFIDTYRREEIIDPMAKFEEDMFDFLKDPAKMNDMMRMIGQISEAIS